MPRPRPETCEALLPCATCRRATKHTYHEANPAVKAWEFIFLCDCGTARIWGLQAASADNYQSQDHRFITSVNAELDETKGGTSPC